METIEDRLVELTRTVYRLINRRNYRDPNWIVDEFQRQGLGEVSLEFVNAIYDQSEKEAQELKKPLRETAIKSLYYTTTEPHVTHYATLWIDRYLVVPISNLSSQNCTCIEIFDPYNNKSV
jgi:hypothetical protein